MKHAHMFISRAVLALFISILPLSIVRSTVTYTKIGDITYYSGYDAKGVYISGSSMDVGGTTFHNMNSGNGENISGTSMNTGGVTFHNFSGSDGWHASGSSIDAGNTTFHNLHDNNGNYMNGTSMTTGSTTYNNYRTNVNERSSATTESSIGLSATTGSTTYDNNGSRSGSNEYYNETNGVTAGDLYRYQQLMIEKQNKKEGRGKLILYASMIGGGVLIWLFKEN